MKNYFYGLLKDSCLLKPFSFENIPATYINLRGIVTDLNCCDHYMNQTPLIRFYSSFVTRFTSRSMPACAKSKDCADWRNACNDKTGRMGVMLFRWSRGLSGFNTHNFYRSIKFKLTRRDIRSKDTAAPFRRECSLKCW